jgi:UDP-2-acetamido-2-deoxy-ribo-hexuluronate aminotransferase
MQFIDLKKQQKRIEKSLHNRLNLVLSHGFYIMGPEVLELETKLAEYTGTRFCCSCASGTDALLLSLMAKGIGPGDAVFVPPFTFMATAEAVTLVGATPVFVDIDPDTYNIDPQKLETAIDAYKNNKLPSAKTPSKLRLRGIISVDIFGIPADYDAINEIAEKNNLFVIEDAAQSFGAIYKGKKTGSLAQIAATSFFPAKPLGCYGDGGAVFTDDEKILEILKSLRVHGQGIDKYNNIRIGMNGRMDTIQAAILLSKMEIFEEEIFQRQTVAQRYDKLLEKNVAVPVVPENCRSAWAQYSVQSDKRDAIIDGLKKAGIPVNIYYLTPLHLQTAFSYLEYKSGSMPVSEEVGKKIFSLPMHPYLTEEEQEKIAGIINNETA